jgi:hypothetical protein
MLTLTQNKEMRRDGGGTGKEMCKREAVLG